MRQGFAFVLGAAVLWLPLWSCTPDGPPKTCLDGILHPDEDCDDGNFENHDGCSLTCEVEEGFVCDGSPSVCDGICGDGLVRGSETCDDGNDDPDDGCTNLCQWERCGDGVVQSHLGEACDDGNTQNGDGCSADCTSDESCGNGLVDGYLGESCDHGAANSDEPDAACRTDCELPRCGDGITDPGLGERCDDGNEIDRDGCETTCQITPTELIPSGFGNFDVDETHVYWAHDTELLSMPLTGGAPSVILSQPDLVGQVAVDATHVYWTSYSQVYTCHEATVMRLAKAGGAPEVVHTSPMDVHQLLLGSTHLYLLDALSGTIVGVPKGSGAPALIAAGLSYFDRFAADSSHLYWAIDDAPGSIMRVPLQGGVPELLVDGLEWPAGLALDEVHLYWLSDGELRRIPKSGGAMDVLANAHGDRAVVDATHVYWKTRTYGSTSQWYDLVRVSKNGGAVLPLWYEDCSVHSIRMTSTHIYWHEGPRSIGTCLGLGADHRLLALPK